MAPDVWVSMVTRLTVTNWLMVNCRTFGMSSTNHFFTYIVTLGLHKKKYLYPSILIFGYFCCNYLSNRICFTYLCIFTIVIREASQFLNTNIILAVLKVWTTSISMARRLTYTTNTEFISNTISCQVTFNFTNINTAFKSNYLN